MNEIITIGVNVVADNIEEQIDVDFVKESNEPNSKYVNKKNEILEKKDIIIEKEGSDNYNVLIEFNKKIVDSAENIRIEFEKALGELTISKSNDSYDMEDDGSTEVAQIQPYDPALIRVEPKQFSIETTIGKIKKDEIDLNPDFQRKFVWTDITRKSRLIESILLRIPLPMFYLSQDEEGIYHVLDGLQRLTVLKSYLNNEFRLKNLEYLKECEGKFFDKDDNKISLEGRYVRRINDTMLHFNVVDANTPEQAKYDIFRRINTGGKPLNRQEMRNAMATTYTRKLLHRLADLEYFKRATGYSVKDTRFADQELVLRFIGFYMIDNKFLQVNPYKGSMASFLDEIIEVLNKYYSFKEEVTSKILFDFDKAMRNSYLLFGERAFKRTTVINKALFLSVSRNTYKYDIQQIGDIEQNILLRNEFLEDKESSFWIAKVEDYKTLHIELDDALTAGTNEIVKIENSYNTMNKIIEVIINEQD